MHACLAMQIDNSSFFLTRRCDTAVHAICRSHVRLSGVSIRIRTAYIIESFQNNSHHEYQGQTKLRKCRQH
jgi:hypothetical protein